MAASFYFSVKMTSRHLMHNDYLEKQLLIKFEKKAQRQRSCHECGNKEASDINHNNQFTFC